MRYQITLLLIVMTLTCYAQSPFWQWAKADTNIVIPGTSVYNKQAIGAHGQKVLLATAQNLKTATGVYGYGDYKLTEHNTLGDTISSTVLNGKVCITNIKSDSTGNWYITGVYSDSLRYGSTTIKGLSFTAPNFFMMRINAGTLNVQWCLPLTGTNYGNVSSAIKGNKLFLAVDTIRVTNIYETNIATGKRTFFTKQISAGTVSSIAADDYGNVYVAGTYPYVGNDTFGNQVISVAATKNRNSYIVRYKADGSYDWSIWLNDNNYSQRQLTIANNNTIYYTGDLRDSLTIGNFKVNKPVTPYSSNYIAASLDSTGKVRWIRQAKDTGVSRVSTSYQNHATLSDSNLVVSCTIIKYGDWGNGIVVNAGGQNASACIMYSPDGTLQWIRRSNSDLVIEQGITSNGKDIWVTGAVRDTSSLDLDTVHVPLKRLAYTPYMAKISLTACEPPAIHIDSLVNGNYIISWNGILGNVTYEYVISSNRPPYTQSISTTGNSVFAGRLPSNTTYYFCVKGKCSNGMMSDYGCDSFTTAPVTIAAINKNSDISIYPNPAQNTISIKGLDQPGGVTQVKIINITGSVLYEKTFSNPSVSETIDVSAYARGMYFVAVKTPKGNSVEKLVLE